jgi:hypothetical protein
MYIICKESGAGVAQSVYRPATGWTVRRSNPGADEFFRTRPYRPRSPPSPIHNGYRVFPGGKAAGAWHCPSTPSSAEVEGRPELYICSSLGLRGLFYGEMYFYLYMQIMAKLKPIARLTHRLCPRPASLTGSTTESRSFWIEAATDCVKSVTE